MSNVSVPVSLLTDLSEALHGAVTWLNNLQSGSRAGRLDAVAVVDYMPNGIVGRPQMHELSERARVLAEVAGRPEPGPAAPPVAEVTGMLYKALHNELQRVPDAPGIEPRPVASPPHDAVARIKLLYNDAGDGASFMVRMNYPDHPRRMFRVTVVEE